MSLTCCAIFKNESHILKEWIDHYINEGVDHFFLINNNSNDKFSETLNEYKHSVTLYSSDKKFAQEELYNKYFLDNVKQFDWAIVCDLDEFIYSKQNFPTIKNYLESLDSSIGQIHVPWKMFGSSGFIEQPKSVIKNFIFRWEYNNPKFTETKTIVRSKFVKKLQVHHHIIDNGTNINSYTESSVDNKQITESIIEKSTLNLNHYAIQSKNWFLNVKATRGDVFCSSLNNIRNIGYFSQYDMNQIEDKELYSKTYN